MTVLRLVGHLCAAALVGLTFWFVALASDQYDPEWALGAAAFCAYLAVLAMFWLAGPTDPASGRKRKL